MANDACEAVDGLLQTVAGFVPVEIGDLLVDPQFALAHRLAGRGEGFDHQNAHGCYQQSDTISGLSSEVGDHAGVVAGDGPAG
jgi:hypothetical protein